MAHFFGLLFTLSLFTSCSSALTLVCMETMLHASLYSILNLTAWRQSWSNHSSVLHTTCLVTEEGLLWIISHLYKSWNYDWVMRTQDELYQTITTLFYSLGYKVVYFLCLGPSIILALWRGLGRLMRSWKQREHIDKRSLFSSPLALRHSVSSVFLLSRFTSTASILRWVIQRPFPARLSCPLSSVDGFCCLFIVLCIVGLFHFQLLPRMISVSCCSRTCTWWDVLAWSFAHVSSLRLHVHCFNVHCPAVPESTDLLYMSRYAIAGVCYPGNPANSIKPSQLTQVVFVIWLFSNLLQWHYREYERTDSGLRQFT